jgi:hypothetical protein
MIFDAVISPDGLYRYRLSRIWDSGTMPLVWIMLNPSTADALKDDPTIRRCISFSKREGYGGIEIVNLFAYRSSSPETLKKVDDPVGPDNNQWIKEVLYPHFECVCAWGAYPAWDRVAEVFDLVKGVNFLCLGRTAAGHPKHPLYISSAQPFIPYLA